MTDFYDKAGKMALGSRLRRLSELMTEQAASIYTMYNIDLHPKWFPVFYALSDEGEKSITNIAEEVGHSHAAVSKTAKEMIKHGLITAGLNKTDLRKNYIRLSKKGLLIRDQIQVQYTDVNKAVESALNEGQYNLWKL
jgi:DNA-binding MarR family transcriptional regulator